MSEIAGAEGRSTPLHEARLESLAVRRGWVKGPWPVHKTLKDVIEDVVAAGGHATLIERTVMTAHELQALKGERARGIGAKLAIAMVKQNQDADTVEPATSSVENHVHQHIHLAPNERASRLAEICAAALERSRGGGGGVVVDVSGANGHVRSDSSSG